MKSLLALVLLAGGAALAGCVVHAHPRHPHRHGAVVVVPAGHVHDVHCGHYFYRGQWYVVERHSHGPGCGHVFKGGIWIIED